MISRRILLGGAAIGALALTPYAALAEAIKAFRLELGGKTIELNPDEPAEVTLPDGTKTTATLKRNEFASHAGTNFSFTHVSALTVAKTNLSDGVVQHLLASALGTIVIIQEYSRADPTKLLQTMLNELTKESKAAGGKISQENAVRTLRDGKSLSGLRGVEDAGKDVADYEVFAYGAAKPALLVVTRMDRDNAKEDRHLLDRFWETLAIKA